MLVPWKKSYDQPRQHIKKQRHYFVNKGLLVKAMVFPVVMYGCESWTIKKVERWRTDVFEPWCWRRLLRVPWTASSRSWWWTGKPGVLHGVAESDTTEWMNWIKLMANSFDVWQKPRQYCKAIILQLKINKFNF